MSTASLTLTEESSSGQVYRGRTIAELIPRIQADLGPEAVVLRRRNGLEGGVGGFFQRPFVEIEARSGDRVDMYDGEQMMPPAPETPTGPALGAFAQALSAAGIAAADTRSAPAPAGLEEPIASEPILAAWTPEPIGASAPEPTPEPLADAPGTAARSKTQLAVLAELIATGIDSSFAEELIDAAAIHVLAFNPKIGLRKAVRIELERRIPTAAPLPVKGAAVALIGAGGSGKTRCLASLASTYRHSGTLKASCASILADGRDGLSMLLSPHITTPAKAASVKALRAVTAARQQGIALIDTPSLSPAKKSSIRALAELLGEIAPDRVVVALPATLSVRAAKQVLQALAPLKPNALAITHADETDQLGVAVQAACQSGLAPEYMLTGNRQALTRLDPATLAQRLLR